MPSPYRGSVTGPPPGGGYRASDGRSYFEILGVPSGVERIYRALALIIRRCSQEEAAAVDPAVRAYWNGWRLRFDKELGDFRLKLERLAIDTAVTADARTVEWIKLTQVRPDTSKANHMRGNIASRPLGGRLPFGAVGVADIAVLNKTRRSSGGPYWEAQEFGSSAAVGRILPGYFMPGKSRPGDAPSRTHPEFRRQTTGRGVPAMVVKNPIEARGFLRRGVEDAGRYRERRLKTLEADLLRLAASFHASTPPPTRFGTPRPPRR